MALEVRATERDGRAEDQAAAEAAQQALGHQDVPVAGAQRGHCEAYHHQQAADAVGGREEAAVDGAAGHAAEEEE